MSSNCGESRPRGAIAVSSGPAISTRFRIAAVSLAWNGLRPDVAATRQQPHAQTSVQGPAGSSPNCSGAM